MALRSEEAYSLDSFCYVATGVCGKIGAVGPRNGGQWFLWLRHDADGYRALIHRMQELAQGPYFAAAGELHQIEAKADTENGYGFMTRFLAPALVGAFRAAAEAQALESAAVVACAATRYRLDHGDYPPSAESLLPGSLAAIPVDPFDGRTLRYKKTSDGSVAIYSVGPDAVDDGGRVEGKSLADVGIILKLPAGR